MHAMQDQLYRLVRGWQEEEWPLTCSSDVLADLNEVAPRSYHYHIEYRHDEPNVIELYEYVGEGDVEDLA